MGDKLAGAAAAEAARKKQEVDAALLEREAADAVQPTTPVARAPIDYGAVVRLATTTIPAPTSVTGTTFTYSPEDVIKTRTLKGINYDLLEELGGGSEGTVYRAAIQETGEAVAVKVFHGMDPFVVGSHRMREMDLRKSLMGTPGIADYVVHGKATNPHDRDTDHILITKYVSGTNLENVIAREGRILPEERARLILTRLSTTVNQLHKHPEKILHRDLKPSNVLLDEEDQVHLPDLGLVCRMDGGTATMAAGGTYQYAAPEQILGDTAKIGPWSDVYGIGRLAWEMLTGETPPDQQIMDAINGVQDLNFKELRDLGYIPQLVSVVEKACQKKPEDRFQSIDEMLGALGKDAIATKETTLPKEGRMTFFEAMMSPGVAISTIFTAVGAAAIGYAFEGELGAYVGTMAGLCLGTFGSIGYHMLLPSETRQRMLGPFTRTIKLPAPEQKEGNFSLVASSDQIQRYAAERYREGMHAYKTGNYAGADAAATDILSHFPDSADAYSLTGIALKKLGNSPSAIIAYQRALSDECVFRGGQADEHKK